MDMVLIFIFAIVATATLALALSFTKEGSGKLAAFFLSGLAAGFALPLLITLDSSPVELLWAGLGLLIAAVAMVNILRISQSDKTVEQEGNVQQETPNVEEK